MTGPEHYVEAERLLQIVEGVTDRAWVAENVLAAQVHATLALTAANTSETPQHLWEQVLTS